jgi:predicted flap endonuclease-1-like 5' DNA nuclease
MAQAEKTPAVDVEKTFSLPVGFASPLWLAFAGAAASGAAFFWMSRWMRPENLEAKLAALNPASATPSVAEPLAEQALEQTIAVTEAVAEATTAAIEPVFDIAQTAAETVMETVIERSAALVEALDPVEPTVDAVAAPAVVTQEIAVEVAATALAAPDDLTRLVGIGPKLAVALAERGVTRFSDIASWTADDLAEVDAALSLKGRAVRDAWVAQARRFSAEA